MAVSRIAEGRPSKPAPLLAALPRSYPMKHLSVVAAFVLLLASPGLSVAGKGTGKGTVEKHHKTNVPCTAKIDEVVCTDDPDCLWDAKKSKCNKTREG